MAAAAPTVLEVTRDARGAAAATSVPADRLEFVDGIRGVAAALVVVHHLPTFVAAPAFVAAMSLGNPWVAIFITLSGFCLYLPAAKRERVEMPRPFGEFMSRRARRIVPPWYASLVFCTLIGLGLRTVHYRFADAFVPQNVWDVLTHLTLTHSLTRYSGSINGPGYTLGTEWQLYLMMFGFVWLARRFGWLPLIGTVALLTAFPFPGVAGNLLQKVLNPTFTVPFLLGMAGARLARRPFLFAGRLSPAAEPALFALIALLSLAGYLVVNPHNHEIACWLAGLATAAGCVFMARRPRSRVARAFGSRAGRTLGSFSYSLYLTHLPLLALIAAFSGADAVNGAAPAGAFYTRFVPALPLVFGFAYGFYLLFERPFLNAAPKARTAS